MVDRFSFDMVIIRRTPMDLPNCFSNKKSIITRVILVLLISLIPVEFYSQQAFTLKNVDNSRIKIDKTFNANSEIKPFIPNKPLSGVAISGNIVLNSDSSMVRVTLIDENYKEFLVCEAYPLLIDSNKISLKEYAEETVLLNNLTPNILRIEIIDATIYLGEILTSKQGKFAPKVAIERYKQQNSNKIKKINENIKKKGGLWVASETSVSEMTYEEKKQLFGGKVPNLQGFEYYAGGIFEFDNSISEVSEDVKSGNNINTNLVSSFDWRNRHGANKPGSPYYNNNPGSDGWITPVKNQGGCGSCYIFGPIAAVEAKVNLNFNRHIDIDLSEQHILSCNKYGASCLGASSNITLMFAQDSGVINESCFPYIQARTECSDKCSDPSERIRISSFSYLEGYTYEKIKKELIAKGPLAANLIEWLGGMGHSMCLIGFATISAGDTVFSDSQNHIIITPNDKQIGRIYLIFKNSWGPFWGNKGYVKVFEESMDRTGIYTINNPIYSLNYSSSSISCNDFDGDGFYYWGLGPKPSYCPACSDQPDGDDSDPCVGPMDEYGHLEFFTPSPITKDKAVSTGDSVPDLYAEGEKIAWYGDEKLTLLLHTGNSFNTGRVDHGVYTYYVTQTISGCESDIVPVKLTILPIYVPPPVAENITVYMGDSVPELIAYGENIKWYSDSRNILYDPRDGQTYNTTLIGDQLWMAENLNFYTPSGSWYYNNDSLSYAETYGRLYTWNIALNSCPIKWHLPSDEEWMELEIFLGMSWIQTYKMGFRGYGIGYKLMETGTVHWEGPNPGATNEVNFKALPAGAYYPEHVSDQFEWLGKNADFLTATDTAYTEVVPFPQYFHRTLINNDGYIGRLLESCFSNAYSVRCVSYPSKPISEQNSYLPTYTLPGKYTYYVTQTISGSESPADTVIFTILSEVSPPEAANISVCENSSVPDLSAKGKNIKWYSNADLSNLLHSGNSYSTGKTLPGIYKYFVTQTIGESESKADTVILTINVVPPAPITQNVSVCENLPVPDLIATGDNIQWFSDSLLTYLLHTGSSYSSDKTEPGTYEYFVTQTISGCESEYSRINLSINPLPSITLGKDTTIFRNQNIILGPFDQVNFYFWNDGSDKPYLVILGNETGIGNHAVSVIVTDTNSCSFSDTININLARCEVPNVINEEACESYTSPSGNYIWTNPGEYLDTIQAADGCDSVITVYLTILSANTSVTQAQSVLTANATDATYQWIYCDNGNYPIEGEIKQTFSPVKDGNYAVIVTQNGCTDTSSCLNVNVNDLPINGFKQNITLYPNPNDGSFSIDLGSIYPTIEITIAELDGRIIQKERRSDSRNVDMTMVASPGMYMAIITSERERAVFKILKR